MIRKKILRTAVLTTVAILLSGCGKKAKNIETTEIQPVTVSAETQSIASKELTNTSLVSFEYTDAEGNTYTLEGKAVVSEGGTATIEVTDTEGNTVVFTGKAVKDNENLSISDIVVKEEGTLVKADGTEIKVTTGTTVADANESNGESDITASEDTKKEIEEAKKEEAIIEAAKEEVKKAENNIANNDSGNSSSSTENRKETTEEIKEEQPKEEPEVPKEEEKEEVTAPVQESPSKDDTQAPTEPEQPAEDNKQEETPTPEPEQPTEEEKNNSSNGNNSGYDFPTVEGPNGPMYGADYEDKKLRGQDVNQGVDKECPYQLKTVTTRYFYNSVNYSMKEGYYYVAIDSTGTECENGFNDLSYQLGKYNTRSKKVGMYSCGMVWFCAFDD